VSPATREVGELAVRTTVGITSTTFPWWAQLWDETAKYATGVNSFVLSVGGLVVLFLTIRKLRLDIRVAKRNLDREP
jgi:hypothetical protein